MAINYTYTEADKTLLLKFTGRLDFASHQAFSEAYHSQAPESVERYTLDLKEITYLDSSALGMLLLLKDYAAKSAKITIINCSADVFKIFEIANFNQLFSITKL